MKQKNLNPPKILIRRDQFKKDGTSTIFIRIIMLGQKKDISLGVSCPVIQFDSKRCRVRSTFPNAENINLVIESSYNLANEIIFKAKVAREPLTLAQFMERYSVKFVAAGNSFIEYIESEIKIEKQREIKANATVKKYNYHLNKLRRFRSKISFEDVTHSFLAQFEEHMRTKLDNQRSSSNNTLKFIRKFILSAISKGLATNNPFTYFKISEEKNEKVKFLTLDEFNRLKDYFNSLTVRHKHYNPLKSFIFSCYTGLRYGDNKRFTLEQVIDNCIYVSTEKTKTVVAIPLLPQAKALLNYEIATNIPNLGTPTDQTCNRALKEVAAICRINKAISTHFARHTFASIALNNGISKDVVQAILGHTSSKQTDHYARLFDSTKFVEMQKLDGIF